jgi:hypothetical protein
LTLKNLSETIWKFSKEKKFLYRASDLKVKIFSLSGKKKDILEETFFIPLSEYLFFSTAVMFNGIKQ